MTRIDDIDNQILDVLIENTRTPFTDIAKRLNISAGTVHVRVKKMEESGIIHGSSLTVDYHQLGYTFIAYIGVYLEKTSQTQFVLSRIKEIPFVTVALIFNLLAISVNGVRVFSISTSRICLSISSILVIFLNF